MTEAQSSSLATESRAADSSANSSDNSLSSEVSSSAFDLSPSTEKPSSPFESHPSPSTITTIEREQFYKNCCPNFATWFSLQLPRIQIPSKRVSLSPQVRKSSILLATLTDSLFWIYSADNKR